MREEIAARFTEVFSQEYEKRMDEIEKEAGACYEREENIYPFRGARITDYGVLLPFDSLAMHCSGNCDVISVHSAGEALEDALTAIRQACPSIRYEGYAAYVWSDLHGSGVCQYEISSEEKQDTDEGIYDFVGEALEEVLADEKRWKYLSDMVRDAKDTDENMFRKILRLFRAYSRCLPSDASDRVIALSGEIDPDLTEALRAFSEALRTGQEPDIEAE